MALLGNINKLSQDPIYVYTRKSAEDTMYHMYIPLSRANTFKKDLKKVIYHNSLMSNDLWSLVEFLRGCQDIGDTDYIQIIHTVNPYEECTRVVSGMSKARLLLFIKDLQSQRQVTRMETHQQYSWSEFKKYANIK